MAKRCDLCNLDIDPHDYESHLLGKKHLKKFEAENFKKGLIERSIFVSRMPPGLELSNIINFFLQFGAIERCKLESNFAIIEFKKKAPVDFLLGKPIWMGSHKLEIKRRKWIENCSPHHNKSGDEEKTASEIVFADLKTKLQAETTFDGEFETFVETIGLKDEEVESNWELLLSSLLQALRPSFPMCEISRFGSSVTGLGFKGSDFDIYLNIGQPIYEEEEKKPGWTPKTVFKGVKSLMYRKKAVFDKIVPIPKAKTPIIKFCHPPTAINCDLSFKNGLGVINSQLIKKLLSLDVRIKPLMIIIKFWAKTFELSGCGKFTNYAIVMLIIFYLQQEETKLLPPILELQKTCEPIYLWNWQVNFDRNAVFPPSSNTSTVAELLNGFFKFYCTFPFDKNVISPSDGCAHLRTEFSKTCAEKGVDADYLSLRRPVCIQDPIELDNNITAGVSEKILAVFLGFCAVGLEICEVAIKNKDKPFLLNLFTTHPVPLKNQKYSEIVISATKTLHAGLPQDFHTRTDIEDRTKFTEDNWYAVAQRLTEDTLRRVFKLEVQQIKSGRESKQQKVAATSDVHSNDDKIVLECTGSYNVIIGRKAKGFCIDPTLSCIDKEALISDEIVNQQKESGVKTTKLHFMCTIIREKNPVRLVLRLNDCSSAKKQFPPLATFLTTKLPSIVAKELIHMLQYNKH